MKSWTQPGDGFFKETITEATYNYTNWTVKMKPDNPKDRVGSAVDRRLEYSHIYIDVSKYESGVGNLVKLLQKELNNVIYAKGEHKGWKYAGNVKFWNKEVFGKLGKDKNDIKLQGRTIMISNSKLGHLGSSNVDVTMLSRNLAEYIDEVDMDSKGTIGSVLNLQR